MLYGDLFIHRSLNMAFGFCLYNPINGWISSKYINDNLQGDGEKPHMQSGEDWI